MFLSLISEKLWPFHQGYLIHFFNTYPILPMVSIFLRPFRPVLGAKLAEWLFWQASIFWPIYFFIKFIQCVSEKYIPTIWCFHINFIPRMWEMVGILPRLFNPFFQYLTMFSNGKHFSIKVKNRLNGCFGRKISPWLETCFKKWVYVQVNKSSTYKLILS